MDKPRIETPKPQRAYVKCDAPILEPQDYMYLPGFTMVSFKMAQQFCYNSGFDSTYKLQLQPNEKTQPDSIGTDFSDELRQFAQNLNEFNTLDHRLIEELLDDDDEEEDIRDASYIKRHVVMEAIEQLNDHNNVQVEYPMYDNIKKYSLEISVEDQNWKTYSPVQTYFAPFDVRIYNPYFAAKLSSVDYNFADYDYTLQIAVFPRFKAVNNQAQAQYHDSVLCNCSEFYPQDMIFRQCSAHEMWVLIIQKQLGIEKLTCDIADVFNTVVTSTNLEYTQLLGQVCDNDKIFENNEKLKQILTDKQLFNSKKAGKVPVESFMNILNQEDDSLANEKRSPILNEVVECCVSTCVEAMSSVFESSIVELNMKRLVFPSIDDTDCVFDVAVRGMVEQKGTQHHFYALSPEQRRAFLAPIIAERLILYQRIGFFSQFMNENLVSKMKRIEICDDELGEQLKFEESSSDIPKSPYLKKMSDLTSSLCNIILRQHQDLLKRTLTSSYSLSFIHPHISTVNGNSDDPPKIYVDVDELLLRPMCSCYACNLCTICENYDFSHKIFPTTQLLKKLPNGIELTNLSNPETLYMFIDYRDLVENSLNLQYIDLHRQMPFVRSIQEELAKNFGFQLSFNRFNKANSIVDSKQTFKRKKPNYLAQVARHQSDQLLMATLLYCASSPRFVQFPAIYSGALNGEYPTIVLSDQFRSSCPFDSRYEVLLAFTHNPNAPGYYASIASTKAKELREKLKFKINCNNRFTLQSQNLFANRGIADHQIPVKEPGQRLLSDYSAAELGFWLYGEEWVTQKQQENALFTQELDLNDDVLGISGLVVSITNLNNLPNVRKGAMPIKQKYNRKPAIRVRSKLYSKSDFSDFQFLGKVESMFKRKYQKCSCESEQYEEECQEEEENYKQSDIKQVIDPQKKGQRGRPPKIQMDSSSFDELSYSD